MKWYVAYTYAKFERKVHDRIQDQGITSFLPLVEVKRKWSDRIKKVMVPLFSSYVFVHTTESKLPLLERVDGLVKFIAFAGRYAVVRQKEIEMIERLLGSGQEVRVEGRRFHLGERAVINDGILAGMEGVLRGEAGKDRFYVEIEELGQIISIEVPVIYLNPVGG